MADPRPTVALLAPVHPLLVDWLSGRATVHYEPGASRIDPEHPAHAGARVLVVRSNVRLTGDLVGRLPRLRLVMRAGSGLDNLPLAELRRCGVAVVAVGGGPSAPAVAELAAQSTVALLRRVPVATAELAAGRWAKDRCVGEEIAGAVVAVWGAGPVGRATERLLSGMGARAYFVAHPGTPPGAPTMAKDRLVATARVHVFALPLRPDTRHVVERAMLDRLRPARPHLVNVGRWDLFDMPAVVAALHRDELSGVAVDPVDREHMPAAAELVARWADPVRPLNLQLLPHLGATTVETHRRVASAVIDTLTEHWHLITPDGVQRVQPQEVP
jgi:D-3-phosphoglycerate dehydrogenase